VYIIHSNKANDTSSKCPSIYALRLLSGVSTADMCTITDCVLGLINTGKYTYRLCYFRDISTYSILSKQILLTASGNDFITILRLTFCMSDTTNCV